ncbi:MAG: GDP-mannose 4,6-dehydratase [Candidatus Sedimenticola sp. 20ELBAFRAG]
MRALICGVGGQDGTYLADLLLSKGYEVWGTSRDAQIASFSNLRKMNILPMVKTISMAPNDFRSVLSALDTSEPDEIYYLAGQSSVALSFEQPAETIESICIGVLNMMESIRLLNRPVKLYHASSSECFGDVGQAAANENTPFSPCSPYAVAKASAHWLVANYRKAYGLYACNGILFNHESPLRPARFVTQKIVKTACRIAHGSDEKLTLGRFDIVRDWGFAPEYVEAMWLTLQKDFPRDYVIATGEASTLESFVSAAFDELNLDWKRHVTSDPNLYRPTDLEWSQGDPERANLELDWKAKSLMADVVSEMVKYELDLIG